MFENAQHVEEKMRTPQIHDQQKGGKNGASNGRDPRGCACKIEMVKYDRGKRNHRRHSGNSAYEKIERNLPGPDRRFDDWLTIVTDLARKRSARDIDTSPGDDTVLPCLVAQFFE